MKENPPKLRRDVPEPTEAIPNATEISRAERVLVRTSGLDRQEWSVSIEPYMTLRELLTSTDFLRVTAMNPNGLYFFVNEEPAEDDLLLVSGDIITFDSPHEKAVITPRDTIKKLRRLAGLVFDGHGKGHDHWRTRDGRRVDFPRHAHDLKIGTLKSIIRQAGLTMSITDFLNA